MVPHNKQPFLVNTRFNFNVFVSIFLTQVNGILVKDTWKEIKKCDILLVRHDHDCGYLLENQAYAHLLDSLGDLFRKNGVVIESLATPFSVLTGSKAHGNPRSYNRLHFNTNVLGFLGSLILGRNWKKEWHQKKIKDFSYKLLQRCKPKIIIGIQPDSNLCQAAKYQGIKVYDLQHGVITKDNKYYGYKHLNGIDSSLLPDCYLCWNRNSQNVIDTWAKVKKIETRVIGNPWFSRFLNDNDSDILVKNERKKHDAPSERKYRILVTLQWGFYKLTSTDDTNQIFMPKGLEDVILKTIDSYDWIVRLHPVQLRGSERKKSIAYLNEVFGNRYAEKWISESEIPLPLLFENVSCHITHSSTVVIEASWYNIPSALIRKDVADYENNNHYEHEISIGIAELICDNQKDIQKWIENKINNESSTLLKPVANPEISNFVTETLEFIR